MQTESMIGKEITCAETGKVFVGAIVGCSTNYATNAKGEYFSDESVEIRERRELLDRSKPFTCYVNSDGKTVGGWKGNVLGKVRQSWKTRRKAWGGGFANFYRVTDVHGGKWVGYGSEGMVITLRPAKA